jgi:thiamine-phosphate pyrophosphorylase
MFDLSLYVITDPYLSKGRSHTEVVRAAVAGGATMIQLREKDTSSLAFYRLADELVAETRSAGVPLIINDRVDIALAIDADGVHVGQDDLPAKIVRNLIGNGKILGVSASTVEEAKKAEKDGADYIGVGAVYATATKADAGEAIGLDKLAEIKRAVRIPVVAIGGIGLGNIGDVIRAGADGAAVVSAVVSAPDMQKAAFELKEVIERSR